MGNNPGSMYAKHLIGTGLAANLEETTKFNMGMDYILRNVSKPEPDLVRAAFMNAPAEVLEYFAQDKWFSMVKDPKDIPVYSQVAREILLERILLSDTERK